MVVVVFLSMLLSLYLASTLCGGNVAGEAQCGEEVIAVTCKLLQLEQTVIMQWKMELRASWLMALNDKNRVGIEEDQERQRFGPWFASMWLDWLHGETYYMVAFWRADMKWKGGPVKRSRMQEFWSGEGVLWPRA